MALSPDALTAALKAEARRLGFDMAGATPAVTPPEIGPFRQWLRDGFAGPMRSMAARAAAYEHPRHVLPGVRSLLMLAVGYRTVEPVAAGPGQGTVARYAWGARLPRPGAATAAAVGRLAPPPGPWGGGPRCCRHGAALGAAVRPTGRTGPLRQEHDPAQPAAGELVRAGRPAQQRDPGLRPADRDGPLRKLSPMPGRMSDRRAGGTVPARRPPLHQLPDDRESRAAAG